MKASVASKALRARVQIQSPGQHRWTKNIYGPATGESQRFQQRYITKVKGVYDSLAQPASLSYGVLS